MSLDITIPFNTFKIKLLSGHHITIPLNDKHSMRIGTPINVIAGKYQELLQSKNLDKGTFDVLLDELRSKNLEKDLIEVQFDSSQDGISFPPFSIQLDYFYTKGERGFWAIIPILGLESFGQTEAILKERLAEGIKFDFAKNRRLAAVQQVVSLMWFEDTFLEADKIELNTPNLSEIESFIDEKPDQLLPKVALLLKIERQEAFGRKNELKQIVTGLKNKFGSNILLVGPAGVGKTALVWELVHQRKKLKIKGNIWETTASTLIKELTRETGWEDNLEFLSQELKQTNDFLFIRNLMELFEVGKYEGNPVSIADYLKPYLSRGEINIISECTEEELALIELQSPNYLSNFQIIYISEPSDTLEDIIVRKIQQIAAFQKLTIQKDAIQEVLRLNKRFSPYAGMPGKPIRFLENMLINKKQLDQSDNSTITKKEIIQHFSEDTGIPLFMIDPQIPMNLEVTKQYFSERLFEQGQAIDDIVNVLAQVKTALSKTGQPIASFLFVGPTGVGKTELAKLLAKFMFGHKNRLTRFDMSEYSTPYDIIRLIGAGQSSDGLLTAAVRRNPFCVLLFDEIEKAHPNFFDLLLQILGEGRLTDSQGKLVNFCSSIIIMTSNIGAGNLMENRIGWNTKIDKAELKQHFQSAVQQYFRPELYNRIDKIIPFSTLSKKGIQNVIERELNLLKEKEGLKFREVQLNLDSSVYDYLIEKGYNEKYGARFMHRTIRHELYAPLAMTLNQHDPDEQIIIDLSANKGKLKIDAKINPKGIELLLEELNKFINANHIGGLRRKCYRLQEGHFYTGLLNELDFLQRREKGEKDFWKDSDQANRFKQLQQLKAQFEKIIENINDLELKLGLACMQLGDYLDSDKDEIERLETRLFGLKQEAYLMQNPGNDEIYFYLFSSNLQRFFNIYSSIFEQKKFVYEAQVIWFRDSIEDLNEKDLSIESNRKKTINYLKTPVNDNQLLMELDQISGKGELCGLEIKVKGACINLFLEEEIGIQQWVNDQKPDDYCFVNIANEETPIPRGVHRLDFYTKNTPRRIFSFPTLKDVPYRINREYKKTEPEVYILKKLEELFEAKLDQELFS